MQLQRKGDRQMLVLRLRQQRQVPLNRKEMLISVGERGKSKNKKTLYSL